MIPFSVLDLAPIVQGGDAAQAFRNSVDLAQHAERWGYTRFWVAEHHNLPGVASAATSIIIAHVAAGTSTIRVGAGGIMLPNHAPLVIAEQFGTLATLYPGRIDLGLGRAPGTDALATRALRRTLRANIDAFPDDVAELMSYFRPFDPARRVNAVPGAGADVPIWILGSSLYGAELAGALGLPFAFASHFAPAYLMEAIDTYRVAFRPSEKLTHPYVMLGVNVCAADSDDEARLLLTSLKQAFVNLRSGSPSLLPPPAADFDEQISPEQAAMLAQLLSCAAVGSPRSVQQSLQHLVTRTRADELILTSQIFDHRARLRSFEIAAALREQIA